MPPHRAYVALHAVAWGAFVAVAVLSSGRRGGRMGLDGDSRGFLLFFLLVGLVAALPACLPPLWRSMGRTAWIELLLAQLPLVAMLAGVLLPYALGARSGAADVSEPVGSAGLVGSVAAAPVVFLLPFASALVARLSSRRSRHGGA